LFSALNPADYAISLEPLQEVDFPLFDLLVDQNGCFSNKATNKLPQSSKLRAIAVVYPSSDITLSVKEIAESRMSLHSSSPYSPDIVYVHLSVLGSFKDEFSELPENLQNPPIKTARRTTVCGVELQNLLAQAAAQDAINIHETKSGLCVVEILPSLHNYEIQLLIILSTLYCWTNTIQVLTNSQY
jgi:hypothetical protein